MVIIRTAIISPCKRYRYQLERSWSKRCSKKSTVVFIGLNPSTADSNNDDPTIRKCMAYAQAWRFKKLVMVNLFAWRATDPEELLRTKNPVGKLNDKHLDEAVSQSASAVPKTTDVSTAQSIWRTNSPALPASDAQTPKIAEKFRQLTNKVRFIFNFRYYYNRTTWFQLGIKRERSEMLRLPPQL